MTRHVPEVLIKFSVREISEFSPGAEFPLSLSKFIGFVPSLLYKQPSPPTENWLSSRCLTSVIVLELGHLDIGR